MHNTKSYLLFLICLILAPMMAFSQEEGTLTKTRFTVGNCSIGSMTVKYNIRSLMGEPIVNGAFKWTPSAGYDSECLTYKTKIALKVQSGQDYAYINISPTVPDGGEGYGYNASGSPSWDDLFCGYGNRSKDNCWSEEVAKDFWKSGFKVVDFAVWW